MLQCRNGKRTGTAALNMAMDMLAERLIDETTAVLRVEPAQLDELLHPIIDPAAEKSAEAVLSGLPAGPGGASGKIVFTSAEAVEEAKKGVAVILVREETNPEDVEGMRAAEGILTARGGMTSHAALVARGWGKCCIVGAGDLKINMAARTMTAGAASFKQGDVITLNGTKGRVYAGALAMIDATENPRFQEFMKLVDAAAQVGRAHQRRHARRRQGRPRLRGRGHRPVPHRAHVLRQGRGRAAVHPAKDDHGDGQEAQARQDQGGPRGCPAGGAGGSKAVVNELFPFVKRDIKATIEAMDGMPVTIRLLDPPLHEFVPQDKAAQAELAKALNMKPAEIRKRGEELHETNPMMGHRGIRLGVTYPEVTEMQVRAIFEASAELTQAGKNPKPEIMVPVTCDVRELDVTKVIVDRVHAEVKARLGVDVKYLYGTMIEIPRAALLADQMAKSAQFFSFGTNDLTQMTFGFSRDDIGGFLPDYVKDNILAADPFQTIDQQGVGQLIRYSVERGRKTRGDLKIGICGEQGGDPASVEFCHKCGLTYVSCSPYRVPIARLAAAHAALKNK